MTIPQPSLRASDWSWYGFQNTRRNHPTAAPAGPGWFIDFPAVPAPFDYTQYPNGPPPSVGRAVVPYKGPLPPGGSLTAAFHIDAADGTVWNTQMEPSNAGVWPASVVLYFSDHNDGGDQYDRWWSQWDNGYFVALGAGDFALTVPLVHDPAIWTSVYGQDSVQASADRFAKALAHPTDVGMTFGGGFYKGHGINVCGGPARFTLGSYSVAAA